LTFIYYDCNHCNDDDYHHKALMSWVLQVARN